MANNRSVSPSPAESPGTADNLRRIKGIGQAVETRLNQAGIFAFAQLAALSPQRIAEMLEGMIGMSSEKIREQDWTGQASRLTSEAGADEAIKTALNPDDRQRYETFSVKLLVDEINKVRRTNIVHVQKGTEQNWAGWNEQRLIAFVVEHAALSEPAAKTTVQMNVESVPAADRETDRSPRSSHTESAGMRVHSPHKRSLRLDTLEIGELGSGKTASIIATDQDWSIRLGWTLSGPEPLFGDWLVSVYLESMGPGVDYELSSNDNGRLSLTDCDMKAPNVYSYANEMKFKAGEVAAGIYWLVVAIAWEKHPGKLGDLMGFSEKSMLQFYDR
ncbi:MAG: hypothetical protein AB8I58_10075 [Anaerolineales bacterium]